MALPIQDRNASSGTRTPCAPTRRAYKQIFHTAIRIEYPFRYAEPLPKPPCLFERGGARHPGDAGRMYQGTFQQVRTSETCKGRSRHVDRRSRSPPARRQGELTERKSRPKPTLTSRQGARPRQDCACVTGTTESSNEPRPRQRMTGNPPFGIAAFITTPTVASNPGRPSSLPGHVLEQCLLKFRKQPGTTRTADRRRRSSRPVPAH